ncbi:MAG: insulinase family protein, partial [Legionellales bacterium]|nr:insulinase family protein [Legionellales bacterium]
MKKLLILISLVLLLGMFFYYKDRFYYIEDNKVVLVNNDIVKSKSDTRNYRMIVLSNGLRSLLISDPDTDEAAVSMRVFAGSFDEPKNSQGIAHFTEHMLFLGNKKYPGSEYYNNYISKHRGKTNAFT